MVRSTLQKRIASALLLSTIAVQLQVSGAWAALQNVPAFAPVIGVHNAEAQAAEFTFSSRAEIRSFVNSLGTAITPVAVPPEFENAGALDNTADTARKICEFKGFPRVVSVGQDAWSSCYDNHLAYWNGSQFVWEYRNACARGNRVLERLTCGQAFSCQDGIDNDGDGLTDFPQDPGCVSAQDTDELNQAPTPQCNDGIDNDNDGATDLADYSCGNNPNDSDETNPKAACQDGADNDGDGLTDFPQDPGCASKQDNDEGPVNRPQLDIEKTAPAQVNAGGTITYSFTASVIGNLTATNVKVYDFFINAAGTAINPPFTFVSAQGASCFYEVAAQKRVTCSLGTMSPGSVVNYSLTFSVPTTGYCDQTIMNQADIWEGTGNQAVADWDKAMTSVQCAPPQCQDGIDNDNDGATDFPNDFSCTSPTDNDETNQKAACQDGADNDGDGLTDFPQDPGCVNAQDNDEAGGAPRCTQHPWADEVVSYRNGTSDISGSPSYTLGAPEYTREVNYYSMGKGGEIVLRFNELILNGPGSDVRIYEATHRPATHPLETADVSVSMDGVSWQSIGTATNAQQCDCNTNATDLDLGTVQAARYVRVRDTSTLKGADFDLNAVEALNCTSNAQCQDGIDNDQDGATDFPNDFSCTSPTDNDETNQKAACQDGLDNDGDGLRDFPSDPGCVNAQDNDEFNQLPQCSDGIDNDQDGATDFPNDFSCTSPTDNDETNQKAACQDGFDNDFDGRVDFPQDTGCVSNQDNDEFNAPLPACRDGIDNDGDGRTDALDPGCSNPDDTNEADEAACQDLRDNDNDGLIDFPFDPGCVSPTDTDEFNQTQTVDVQIQKSGPPSVVRGQTMFYVIQVGNSGNATATNVVVTDTVPAGLTYNDGGSFSACSLSSNLVTCPIGTLPAGVFGSFQIAFDVPTIPNCPQTQTPPVVNSATITSTEDSSTQGNNTSSTLNAPTRIDCPTTPQCSDGIDNDQDGATDLADFSCGNNPNDTDETNPKAQCQDGFDNDFDGNTDFPLDPGCVSRQDNDESNAPATQCTDGIDNDGDGRTDGQDAGCQNPNDNNEGDGPADLAVNLVGPQTVTGGSNATYVATIRNNGPDAVTTPFTMTANVPAGTTFNAASSSQGCIQNGAIVTCSGITLAAGATTTRTIAFSIPGTIASATNLLDVVLGVETAYAQVGGICNTTFLVTVTVANPANPDTVPGNNSSSVSTFVSCQYFQCSDGFDNDFDGRVDFPLDPGCSSPQDNNEGDEAACQDRRDNDGDGLVDWPLDPGCISPVDTDEFNAPLPQCSDGVDNDNDGRVDMLDPGCSSPQDNNESDDPQCSDRIDNDGDGRIDFPLDPGCASPADNDEASAPLPQCSDGIDNDFDGKIDFPLDPGCQNAQDNLESDDPVQFGCIDIVKQTFDPHGTPLPISAQFTFILDATRVAYNDAAGNARFDNVIPGQHSVAEIIPSGWTQLSINPPNGLVSVVAGTNCARITFQNRQVFVANAQCSDGYDNDGDGLIDFPQDSGCTSAADNDEYNSTFVPQCRDGIDNDSDGLVDFPQDVGCQNADDNNEQNNAVVAACADNIDNDGDGLKDYPADPGCSSVADTDEFNAAGGFACNDNVDNDGDGLKDFPQDPGCSSTTDTDEFNFRGPRCSDGIDNDGDGLIDYPQDTGCTTAYDDNEYNDRLWLDRWREWWNWNW